MAEPPRRFYDPMAMTLSPQALVLGWAAAALAALGSIGCSSGLEGVEKRLGSMQDEITKLQNQNDRLVERVDAMEVREAKAEKAAKASGSTASAASERPSLKVVKVVPEDTSGMPSPQVGTPAPGEAADDPGPRPVIKLRGKSEGKGKSDKSEGEG